MVKVNPPEYIIQVLGRLAAGGYSAYLVGGCVRDSIMGRPVHDWDITSSAKPEEAEDLFEKTVQTGKKYGTVTVIMPESTVEVTTFRTESGCHDGRRPSNVGFVSSPDEDLARRDFTMNAIAVSASGEVLDPFGGTGDIEKRVIRCVGRPDERFAEDALRMFRAFRFSAELGFEIEPGTLAAISANAGKARRISAERVRVELERTLLSQKPEIAGEMIKTGLLARYLTSTANNRAGFDDSADFGGRADFGRLAAIAALPAEAALRWCAFCAILLDNGSITSAGSFLRAMRLDSKTTKACAGAMSALPTLSPTPRQPVDVIKSSPNSPDRIAIKKLLAEYGMPAVRCAAATFDTLHGKTTLQSVNEVLESGECFSTDALAIDGNDLIELGHAPGREIGETLATLLDHVIQHPEANTFDDLIKIVEEIRDR